MAKIPEQITDPIADAINKHHENKQSKPRPHMGCSQLGHPCDRWLWLNFRWAVIEKFPGRILRLFRRGQNEESTVVADLRAIGLHVSGTQNRVRFGSHVSGSIDGIVKGLTKEDHVLEIKTHSKKSFDSLMKEGVQKSKPQHYTQMQVYMHGTGLNRALYVSRCKDDDRQYNERVHYDPAHAERMIDKGKSIATSDTMPAPLSTDPSWYQCKFCAAHDFCHKSKKTKEVNCRTCAHSTAEKDGTWSCAYWKNTIPTDFQYQGCDNHVLHPDLVPWELDTKKSTDTDAVYMIDGKERMNGGNGYKSRELLSGNELCDEGDTVRRVFDGEYANPKSVETDGTQPDAVVVDGKINGIPVEDIY